MEMDAQAMMATTQHLVGIMTLAGMSTALLGGFALGLLHFGTLWWNARWFSQDRPVAAFLLQILRLALVTAAFAAAARFGAAPLLSAVLGFLAARGLVLRKARRLS
jgi:F1F0 ATPase subunit 2